MSSYQTSKLDSKEWFYSKIEELAGKQNSLNRARNMLLANFQRSIVTPQIGKMIMFAYDPKYKDTLPIYDKFPLIFPLELYSDGSMLGLNIHYLSPAERLSLLNQLMKFRNNKKMDDTTKLKISYDILASTRRISSLMRPCIKKYLPGHVRSRLIEIEPSEWDRVVQLPFASWVVN